MVCGALPESLPAAYSRPFRKSRWLVRHGRIDDAKAVVRRLTSSVNTEFDVDKNVALMVYTNEQEKAAVAGTSYLDCFRGIDRRRTEIACVTWIIQNASGSAFMNYSTCKLLTLFDAKDRWLIGLCATIRFPAAIRLRRGRSILPYYRPV